MDAEYPTIIAEVAAAKLESVGIKYMLTGSMACGFYAEARMTKDIDMSLNWYLMTQNELPSYSSRLRKSVRGSLMIRFSISQQTPCDHTTTTLRTDHSNNTSAPRGRW